MGGFAAEFRGFRVAQGCGAAIQRTADMAGARGEKIFKKFLKTCEKPKNWGVGGTGRRSGCTLYRVCGAIFGSGIF